MRYGVSDMTLWRWENDPALGFPKPIRINGRRYWRIADLQAFEARQASKREAA
ncbi:transcriptional regulator [Methylobacterium sp. WL19]|nr:transcriptional regulator [Methylobacterium sp. WL19]